MLLKNISRVQSGFVSGLKRGPASSSQLLLGPSISNSQSPYTRAPSQAGLSQSSSRMLHGTPTSQNSLIISSLLAATTIALAKKAFTKVGQNAVENEPKGLDGKVDPEAAKAKQAAPTTSHKAYGAEFWARKMYGGPFESKMTRKEAGLILGVRETAEPKKIQERHRKLLIANHPDLGGSTFVAGKINEAKDVLLKGKGV